MVILVTMPSWFISTSSLTEWTLLRFIAPSAMTPRSIRRLTNSMLRSSRSSEALKLISLRRLTISDEVFGSSSR